MKVTSLEQMENIVRNNNQLYWNGWDVERLQPRPNAWSNPSARYFRNKWHLKTTYPITENGWSIPDNIVR